MECAGQVEIDPKCRLVLAKHWPSVKRIGDIRDVRGDEFGTVDLICGGFPCQPFSTAGKRKGKEDNRFLWPEMVRVIAAYRPTWVIGENVAGIVSMALDQVHSDLEGIGYTVQSFIIPACAVGASHRRDRVWIIGHSTNGGWNERETTRRSKNQGKRERQTGGSNCVKDAPDTTDTRAKNLQRGWQDAVFQIPDAPDTTSYRRERTGQGSTIEDRRESGSELTGIVESRSEGLCQDVPDSCGAGLQGSERGGAFHEQKTSTLGSTSELRENVCSSIAQRLPDWCGGTIGQPYPLTEFEQSGSNGETREIERDFCGVSYGVSHRLDRLKQLGNAVVPQIPEIIGRAIMQVNLDQFKKETPSS